MPWITSADDTDFVDIAQQVASRFGAMSIPTLILLDRGVERSRRVGALPEPQLRAWVDDELSAARAQNS